MADITAGAIKMADLIASRCTSADQIVKHFDMRGLRYSKPELEAVAHHHGLSTHGTRSQLCYRIARHLCE